MRADLRAVAASDIDAAITYYQAEADSMTALSFVEEVEAAIEHLCKHPLTGSLRFAFELRIPELRSWPLNRFPYLVFYVVEDSRIDIWRVLNTRQDIPAHLATS